jgi:PAS domain S-box-containing protein
MAKRESSLEELAIARQAIEIANNPIVFADLEGRIFVANSACEHLLGYRREELLGEHLSILYPSEAQGRFRRIFQEAKAQGFGQGELKLVKRDGKEMEGQVSMTLIPDGAGGYRGIAVVNRDISELMAPRRELEERVKRRTEALRASQEQLQALSRVAAKIQGVLDEERVLALAAEEFAKLDLIAGFWSVEDGGRAIVLQRFALRPQLLAALRRVLGSDPLGFRLPLVRPPYIRKAIRQGEIVVIDNLEEIFSYRLLQSRPEVLELLEREVGGVVYAPLLVRGEAVGLMTVAFPQVTEEDIRTVETFACHLSIALENARLFRELERSYERLEQAQEELLQAERLAAIGQLAGSIAHQLRNPLGVIRSSAFYLKAKLRGPERKVREHLELIEGEIRQVDKRISDLLALAYHSSPRMRRLDLRPLVKRALAQMELPEGIELTMEFDGGPLRVEADPEQIGQLCYNIIENALQALAGGGRLAIRGYEAGDEVVLEFADNGPGLSQEEAARAFEPLFTTKTQGTGLGLTICKQIVEAHGGEIDFESTEGQGSRVIVRLPNWRVQRNE